MSLLTPFISDIHIYFTQMYCMDITSLRREKKYFKGNPTSTSNSSVNTTISVIVFLPKISRILSPKKVNNCSHLTDVFSAEKQIWHLHKKKTMWEITKYFPLSCFQVDNKHSIRGKQRIHIKIINRARNQAQANPWAGAATTNNNRTVINIDFTYFSRL